MAFFSSDREVSESYAKGKEDTSLMDEMGDYEQWFKYKLNGRSIPLGKVWWYLTSEQRQAISERAPHVTFDDYAEEIIYDENTTRGVGNYEYEIKRHRGNALQTLIEGWLTGGSLYDREDDFLTVLEMVGISRDEIDYIDPYTDHSKVYDVYLSFKSPLVTDDIPKKVLTRLSREAKKQPKPIEGYGIDGWDKTTQDPIKWVEWLKEDYANGESSMVWTSIPDWVTDVLKEFGYDGIIDVGGKSGGEIHKVYIPFAPSQIKSVENRGTFDLENQDIYFQHAGAAGVENSAEISDAAKEWEEKGTESKYFKRWFDDSKVTSEDGKPLVVYHGSVNTFDVFDKDKASAEGDMGAGFYFTDNEYDVDSNYFDGGADFDNKVERLAERIQYEEEIDEAIEAETISYQKMIEELSDVLITIGGMARFDMLLAVEQLNDFLGCLDKYIFMDVVDYAEKKIAILYERSYSDGYHHDEVVQ
jgi:hypothetical protein